MSRKHILVIEDEPDIAEVLAVNLRRSGFDVSTAGSGEDGLAVVRKQPPDLIVLDVMLPGIDGIEVCRAIRQEEQTRGIPIIMLTARDEEPDIVSGLEVGADDYLTKPCSPKVLAAHARAILRRSDKDRSTGDEVVSLGSLRIDESRHEVRHEDQPLSLTVSEFRLLLTLAKRPGMVRSRDQLVDAIRGYDAVVTDRTIDVHIASLRKKLGDAGKMIETVRGVGYRIREDL